MGHGLMCGRILGLDKPLAQVPTIEIAVGEENMRVSDLITLDRRWDLTLLLTIILMEVQNVIQGVSLVRQSTSIDRLIWRVDNSGIFTVIWRVARN